MKKLAIPGAFLIIAAIFAFTIDQPISLWFDEPARNSWRLFALEITDIGKGEQWFGLSLFVYFGSQLILKYRPQSISRERASNIKNWSLHFFAALIVSGFFLQLTKIIFGRQRPHVSITREALIFHPFNFNWDFQSFASGHTQTLFCVASLFVSLWPQKSKWIWLTAGLLAFTRVMALQHFVSDVIGGALLGIYGTQLSFYLFSRKTPVPQPLNALKR